MARLGRYFLPDQPLHVIQRGNNREPIFYCEDDYVRYRDWLVSAAPGPRCAGLPAAVETRGDQDAPDFVAQKSGVFASG